VTPRTANPAQQTECWGAKNLATPSGSLMGGG
jgi:hypothetical protein